MNAAYEEFAGEPRQEQPTCLRCGRALPSVIKRQNGEKLCDGCDSALQAGEVPTHWEE